MKMTLKNESAKPMYEQIVDAISDAIYNKELADHEMLPSVRQLATQLNVSAITTKRAYSELERAGLVYTISGKGTFVKLEHLAQLREQRTMEVMSEMKKLLEEAKELGIGQEEWKDLLEMVYGGAQNEEGIRD